MWFVLTICGRGPVGSSLSHFHQSIFSYWKRMCAPMWCDFDLLLELFAPSRYFPITLSSAQRTVMAGAYSDGHSKCLCTFSPHQVCMSALWPEGEPLTNAGCCLQIKPAGKKKTKKKNWHTSFPILLWVPPALLLFPASIVAHVQGV